jgi:hypothetical protein
VLAEFGNIDTVAKRNPTYVLEFNDKWGYHGEYVNGQKTGDGYEIYQDGRKYVGQFSNNMPNGYGTLYSSDNKIISKGKWQNGVLIDGN